MRYRVEITEPAGINIEDAHDWIAADSEKAAHRWIDGLLEQIESLANMPDRCPLAPEDEDHTAAIRQLLYGNYRILFTVQDSRVFVLHVRHGARDWAKREDLNRQ